MKLAGLRVLPYLVITGIKVHDVFPSLITLDERVQRIFLWGMHGAGDVLSFFEQGIVEKELWLVADHEFG